MVKLLIIVVVLIALAGGAFVGLTHFGIVPDVLGLGLGPQQEGEAVEQAVPEPAPVHYPEYAEVEPFILPVILEGKGVTRSIYFDFRLKVKDGNGTDVRRQAVRMKDAFMRYLHQWIPLWMRDHSDIDLKVMKAKLRAVADRVVGKPVVDEVLLQAIFDQ